MYIVISVCQSDVNDARAFFASHFGNKLHDVAGRAVIFVPLGGSTKPSRWLKCHKWQRDWKTNSIAKHFRDLPIDSALGNTPTRSVLQSFTAPGNTSRVFTAVERCRGGGSLLLFHRGQHSNAMVIVMDMQSYFERHSGAPLP